MEKREGAGKREKGRSCIFRCDVKGTVGVVPSVQSLINSVDKPASDSVPLFTTI